MSKSLVTLPGSVAKIHSLDWSRVDSNELATAAPNDDVSVKIWSLRDRRERAMLRTKGVSRLRYSPVGVGLLTSVQARAARTGGADVLLWSVACASPDTPLQAFTGASRRTIEGGSMCAFDGGGGDYMLARTIDHLYFTGRAMFDWREGAAVAVVTCGDAGLEIQPLDLDACLVRADRCGDRRQIK